jgi:hypothetical protein
MKKIFSISLILVLLYSVLGFYLNFKIEQFWIKEEIEQRIIKHLPEKDLTLIKISSANSEKIHWTEESSEFRYDGEMYDVVKTRSANDTTYYYCYNDEKESKLMTCVDKLVKEQTTGNSKSRTVQKKQVITYFFQQVLHTQFINEKSISYLDFSSCYKPVIKEVLSPPAQSIVISVHFIS